MKVDVINPMDETGNSMFNLKDAIPLTEAELAAPPLAEQEPLDYTKIDKMVLTPATNTERAQSAITQEDLAFEASLQRMHVESVLPVERVEKLEPEATMSNFLGDLMKGYEPAKTLNELEQQVFAAKSRGADSIEASEDIIRYYNRAHYPKDVGYFIYKNIKVFIPGRFDGYVQTDTQNLNSKLRGL